MGKPPPLDHVVINVRYSMDAGEAAFGALGFQLTPRGYHSLGSINHLMMFGTDYLELIGLPAESEGKPVGRADIAAAPVGINGLVFKTSDVDETFAHLQSIGMAGDPPKAFTRPVTLPDGEAVARFRTVTVRADVFGGGRVYFCEHGTPELVWREAWQVHDNGSRAMPEFVVASSEHAQEAEDFARLLRSEVVGAGDELSVACDGCTLTLLTPGAYRERYGELASDLGGRASIFGAVVIRTDNLDAAAQSAKSAGLRVKRAGTALFVRQDEFDSVLEFVA